MLYHIGTLGMQSTIFNLSDIAQEEISYYSNIENVNLN